MIHLTSRLKGGVTEQDVANMMNHFRDQLTQMQIQLQEEKDKSELLRKQVQTKNHDQGGIISAIRKGQMKEISPKKFTNLQTSGNFKSWSKTMKDFIFWHDKDSQQLLEYFEENWLMDERLSYKDVQNICEDREMGVQEDAALHMVIGAFLEGESKVLADTSELTDLHTMQSHKSGLELWRQLKYNFDRSSAFNVITILESVRSMSLVKNVQDVLPKISILEKAQQEYYKQAVASKDPEFIKMKAAGINVYPEMFKKADLLKILPEMMVNGMVCKSVSRIQRHHDPGEYKKHEPGEERAGRAPQNSDIGKGATRIL